MTVARCCTSFRLCSNARLVFEVPAMSKKARLTRFAAVALMIAALPGIASGQLLDSTLSSTPSSSSPSAAALNKLGPLARRQISRVLGRSRVIVRAVDGTSPDELVASVQAAGGAVGKKLSVLNAQSVELPNAVLLMLAENPL